MAGVKQHDYHILPPSIWPFTGAVGAVLMLVGLVLWFHDSGPWLALIGFVTVLYTMWSWWADVIAEGQAGEALFLRVERQTLRRLPRTGGVVFTIRVWRDPLASLAGDPARLAAFARAWRGATPEFRAYKGLAPYDALVEGFLRAAGE